MTDELTLKITPANQSAGPISPGNISGWQEVVLSRSATEVPNTFRVAYTDRFSADSADEYIAQPGDQVECYIDADLVLTGYIDRVDDSIAAGFHNLSLAGRGKCQDLVDCSADWPGSQISGSNAVQVAAALAKAYGIAVNSTGGADLPPIPQFNIMFAETPFDIIERMCRYSALLAYEQADGNLLLTTLGSVSTATVLEQGKNIQDAVSSMTMMERYSEYRGYLLALDLARDQGDGSLLQVNLTDDAPGAGVPRRRMKAFVAESVGGVVSETLVRQRVQWEMNRRNGRSRSVIVVTDSWRDQAGQLWQPNCLIDVFAPAVKIDTLKAGVQWAIESVEYTRGEQGTRAILKIVPPSAFLPQPTILQPVAPDVPFTGAPVTTP